MGEPTCEWQRYVYEVTTLDPVGSCPRDVLHSARLDDPDGAMQFHLCYEHAGTAAAAGFTLHPSPAVTVGRLAADTVEPTADDVERFQHAERRVVDGTDAARFDAWKRGLRDLTDEQLAEWIARSDLQTDQRAAVRTEAVRRFAADRHVVVCPDCAGYGYSRNEMCPDCHGQGTVPAPAGFVPRDFQAPERGVVAPLVAAAVLAAPLVLAAGWEAWESYRAWRTGRRVMRVLRDLGAVDRGQ